MLKAVHNVLGEVMNIEVLVHPAEEGGYWAECLDGCFTQGETLREIESNMREAVECYFDNDAEFVLDLEVLDA
ncbi:hypothetical protein FACS1894217_08510 [Clostridia bacterium]|nr:hypothetical protein FACS1894217_08510 [Clostridia bacterium]